MNNTQHRARFPFRVTLRGSGLFLSLALLLLSPAFLANSAVAQTSQPVIGLSITPTLSEVQVKPGERVTHAFTVTNEGDLDVIAVPRLLDFIPDPETGAPIILPNQSSFPYASLQNLDISFGVPFPLPAGGSEQLVVSIRVPEDAQLKDYYQTLVVQTTPAYADLRSAGPQAGASIGVHMLIRLADQTKQDVTLASQLRFSSWTVPRLIDSFSPLLFRVFIENGGTTYTKVSGSVRVISMGKEILKLLPILPENILAGSVRELRAAVPDPDQQGAMLPAEFRHDPGFLLGLYTVQLRLGSEYREESVAVEQTVIAFPFSVLATTLLMIILWIIIRKTTRRVIQQDHRLTTTTKTMDDDKY